MGVRPRLPFPTINGTDMIHKAPAPESDPSQTGQSAPDQLPSIAAKNLTIVSLAPLISQVIASLFNIWYNSSQIQPLLTAGQFQRFTYTVAIYNAIVYPVVGGAWVLTVATLGDWGTSRLANHRNPFARLIQLQRRTINLPWYLGGYAAAGWLLCIPVFLISLASTGEPLDRRIYVHLPLSFLIAAGIGVTHGFFVVEATTQRYLYPLLFHDSKPSKTPGIWPLSLTGRGLMWIVSAVVCPIALLLLLNVVPHSETHSATSEIICGIAGIVFSVFGAWLIGRWVSEPVRRLRDAARRVAEGDLDVEVNLLRADEFGPLIDEFNLMVEGLREKELLAKTFGLHVGQLAAQQILKRDPGLGGTEQELTIMFVDIREFSSRCASLTPQDAVRILNLFLTEMVDVVTQHGGMVNKFLGDGFMALFGIEQESHDHPTDCVKAGIEMLGRLGDLNSKLADCGDSPISIGIGIHTGAAIVGSIGSSQRMEYTAIGDAVNISARVEALTKRLKTSLLMTAATRRRLPQEWTIVTFPEQSVQGQPLPVRIYGLDH